MADLKPKVTLKLKGEEAFISVKQLIVNLSWTSQVDLDLMAFYKAKDGRTGGVFSTNYSGGSMGNLNAFPYIQLSEDAGVGAKGGPNEEMLRITKLNDIGELYICTVNFTDAVHNKNVSFNKYDAQVSVTDDRGETVFVPLDSNQAGTVAVIAKIDNTGFMGAKLVNMNQIMDLKTFQSTIPGANSFQITSKSHEQIQAENRFVELKKKAVLAVKKSGLDTQRAMVAVALDISGSMKETYQRGIIQRACERLLALGVKFDDNGEIDIFLFGQYDYELGSIGENSFYEFVNREIVSKRKLEYETNYAGVMGRIVNKYFPGSLKKGGGFFGMGSKLTATRPEIPASMPAFVIFITDGDNFDHQATREMITETSKLPIFWQFVGIGSSSFGFLESLDTMGGRFVDNANFFQLNDIDRISDDELYKRLLVEFPSWVKLAREKRLIK